MERNQCYKYETVRRFLSMTNQEPVKTVLDIGSNVGAVAKELMEVFPCAWLDCYEPISIYYGQSLRNVPKSDRVRIFNSPVYNSKLVWVHFAQPSCGPGWSGGSLVTDDANFEMANYIRIPNPTESISLEAAIQRILDSSGRNEVDFVKMDCEGSERNLLQSGLDTLKRIRFISGEYHLIQDFWPIIKKLSKIFYFNLFGDKNLGSFFMERRNDSGLSLLWKEPIPEMVRYHFWVKPVFWHQFNPEYVFESEKWFHGLN